MCRLRGEYLSIQLGGSLIPFDGSMWIRPSGSRTREDNYMECRLLDFYNREMIFKQTANDDSIARRLVTDACASRALHHVNKGGWHLCQVIQTSNWVTS